MGMAKLTGVLLCVVVAVLQVSRGTCDLFSGTADGTEEWGYSDVRPGAHLFWWLYYKDLSASPDIPLVLWLQGGPGKSGAGYGNFREIGPLDVNRTAREFTWLKLAHLLFVDSPVGTGFSYVDDSSLNINTTREASHDLLTFLKTFFSDHAALKTAPFYIVGQSYGANYAVDVGLIIAKAIKNGELDLNFQGIGIGSGWISPTDSVLAWPEFLKAVSALDENQADLVKGLGELAVEALREGNGTKAGYAWATTELAILNMTDRVNFFNFLKHDNLPSISLAPLENLMNGPIREKLSIIPSSLRWVENSDPVLYRFIGDIMVGTLDEVDELLSLGVHVTVYIGQLDLIVCAPGTLSWVQKLKWPGLANYNVAMRTPLYCGTSPTQAFVKTYENFAFYWFLNSSHSVPADSPCAAFNMLTQITNQSSLAVGSSR